MDLTRRFRGLRLQPQLRQRRGWGLRRLVFAHVGSSSGQASVGSHDRFTPYRGGFVTEFAGSWAV